jgi:hypothetical protein
LAGLFNKISDAAHYLSVALRDTPFLRLLTFATAARTTFEPDNYLSWSYSSSRSEVGLKICIRTCCCVVRGTDHAPAAQMLGVVPAPVRRKSQRDLAARFVFALLIAAY